jgi:hypothetical protein
MELSILNELLLKAEKENEMFELENENDLASIHFVNSRFVFILNAKPLFSLKKISFKEKLMSQIKKRNLKLVDNSFS